jgi:peptidyl-prolyl cis-trans isomerase C
MIAPRWNRLLVAAFAVVTAGCAQEQSSDTADTGLGPTQVATVNGQPIPESVFRVYTLSTLRKNSEQLTPEERQTAIDDLVGITLLADEARKEGLTASRAVAAQLELNRLQLVARAMATSYLENNPVTEAELQEIYEENLPRLSGQQYKARHILLESETEANSVIEQLRAGQDFVALATERSNGPTGPNGGDLGWFTADSMVQPVAEAVRGMEVGTYSAQPVQTEFGYHVLLLEDTRAQEPPSLDSIRADLTGVAERNKIEAYMRTLRDAADVKPQE